MSFLSRAFTGQSEARTVAQLNSIPKWSEASMVGGGVVSDNQAMSLGAFYACVTLLADTIASLSIKSYRYKGEVKTIVKPQPKLFQDSPYPGLTWFDWLWMLMESLAVAGNAFGYITSRDDVGRPIGIMPVHPDTVGINAEKGDGDDWLNPVYRINGKRVDSADVIHIKRYPVAGCAYGMSPIEKMAADIGLALSAGRYGLRWFKDSANPSGILATEQTLDPTQEKRALKSWIQSHNNRRIPAVLSGGLKWQTVHITPEESQFLATRAMQVSEIARRFRIPPHMIGDTEKSTSWGTGLEQQSIGFTTYTLRPWLTCIEQALAAILPNGQFAKFNIDGLLRGDVKTRWEAYQLGRDSGVYSVNDIRGLEDLPPLDGPEGDIHLQPMNFVRLGYEPPEPEPGPDPQADSGEEGTAK